MLNLHKILRPVVRFDGSLIIRSVRIELLHTSYSRRVVRCNNCSTESLKRLMSVNILLTGAFKVISVQQSRLGPNQCKCWVAQDTIMRLATRGFRVPAALLKPHLDLTTLHWRVWFYCPLLILLTAWERMHVLLQLVYLLCHCGSLTCGEYVLTYCIFYPVETGKKTKKKNRF